MTTIETVEALDEMRARAMHPTAWSADVPWSFRGTQPKGQSDELTAAKWWDRNGGIRKNTLAAARSIRESDERAGLVTVHREPTKAMLKAVTDIPTGNSIIAKRDYAAMLAASPFAPRKE